MAIVLADGIRAITEEWFFLKSRNVSCLSTSNIICEGTETRRRVRCRHLLLYLGKG